MIVLIFPWSSSVTFSMTVVQHKSDAFDAQDVLRDLP